ncbi:hypothetical protein [uncultured Vibrio sp.]|uniref:hypothetical protein n=1 Tax=uncultured Vibrio sp. TaxID=114054 RepID=UPI00262AA788|nr:hypothetical protein [uncultured Vibrio sp.]
MKNIVFIFCTTILIGCSDDKASEVGPVPPESVIDVCENQGCTLDTPISTVSLTVSNAPIILTPNGSITLE